MNFVNKFFFDLYFYVDDKYFEENLLISKHRNEVLILLEDCHINLHTFNENYL